jgi:outer membrane protein assembly factor BamA
MSDHVAKIRNRTLPAMTQQALSDGVNGTVIIEAVLCRDGRITDLEVLQDLPNGLTQEAIRSVLGLEFTPAEINFHSVSQKMRFEFSFNDHKSGVISPREAEGKSIRSIEVVGNRRLQDNEIIGLLKTEPGNQFSAEYAKQDLASLLATGYFNPNGTSVTAEGRPDGDVTVIVEVQELPLISEVRFEGLEKVISSQVISALQNENMELRPGAVYDLGKVKTITGIIERVLEKSGQKAARVELRTEQTSFDRVSLTFVISHQ